MLTNTNLLDHFPQLSDQQTSIIEHIHGPLLVIAGPGSGKTTTLALRALNLLVSGHALPQQVMLCTFSQRAARELRQCFYRAADKVGYGRDLAAGVRIGTIHSLCHHVISTQDDAIASGSDLVMLDRFQQMAFIQGKVDEIAMPNQANRFKQRWGEGDVATGLAESFNTVSERLIDPRTLTMSDNALHRAVGGELPSLHGMPTASPDVGLQLFPKVGAGGARERCRNASSGRRGAVVDGG